MTDSNLPPSDDQGSSVVPPVQNSYVDAYEPPVASVTPAADSTTPDPTPVPAPLPQVEDADKWATHLVDVANDLPADVPPVMAPQAPVTPAPTAAPAASSNNPISQALEDQNIFFLLGVQDGTDEEKEAFLDELQEVIWDDFLDQDVELLLTEEEMTELKAIQNKKDVSEDQIQEDIVVYLEKLIPDLEEIMLEKALELKADMVKERIAGMREFYAADQAAQDKINQAQQFVDDNQWRDAAAVLNGITA